MPQGLHFRLDWKNQQILRRPQNLERFLDHPVIVRYRFHDVFFLSDLLVEGNDIEGRRRLNNLLPHTKRNLSYFPYGPPSGLSLELSGYYIANGALLRYQ